MADIEQAESQYFFTDATAMPWRASAFAPGVEVKNLGTTDGHAMQLVRFQPGTTFPTHRHAGPEFIYMLEGEAIQNGQRLGPGWASVATSGTIDEQFRSETGCVFLLVYSKLSLDGLKSRDRAQDVPGIPCQQANP